MQPDGQKRTLLDKWKIVRAAARDNKRLSAGDIAVLLALCDRYGNKTDPDRPPMAGHALLGAMSGLSRRGTIDSTKRLIDAGYISVLELGSGTRGTVYNLNFARGEAELTTKQVSPSGEAAFTSEVKPSSLLEAPSGEAQFTESPPTEAPLQGGRQVVGNSFEATPLALLADGQEATAAQTASGVGGFEEFWKSYPRKHGKTKAAAAYAKLAPSSELHATILSAVSEWSAHYEKHDVDKKWIPEPANWLAKERWDEDLPIIHGDSKGAAIAKAKANALPPMVARAKNLTPMVGKIDDFSPFGTFTAEIVDAQVFTTADTEALRIELEWDGGRTWHKFYTRLEDTERHAEGQAMLASITRAAGIEGKVEDSDELLFRPMLCTIEPGEGQLVISYSPLAANDNIGEIAA